MNTYEQGTWHVSATRTVYYRCLQSVNIVISQPLFATLPFARGETTLLELSKI